MEVYQNVLFSCKRSFSHLHIIFHLAAQQQMTPTPVSPNIGRERRKAALIGCAVGIAVGATMMYLVIGYALPGATPKSSNTSM
jgi:hypothetical protein